MGPQQTKYWNFHNPQKNKIFFEFSEVLKIKLSVDALFLVLLRIHFYNDFLLIFDTQQA